MAEAAPESVECSFCFLKDEFIQDPRVLPCSHIFCRGCLAGQLEELKVIRCPPCNKVFDVVVDNLPTYKPDGPKHKCDVCTKKGKGDQPAVMYCNSCTKKYCDKHQQSHNDVHEDHVTMTIVEYADKADRLETRNCVVHRDQIYSLGCHSCLSAFCINCLSSINCCANGMPHQLVSLGDLVTKLTGDINKLGDAMKIKEEKLSSLFKKTSKYISEFDDETKEMIEKLHETRDKQIAAIQTKYNQLEEELMKARIEVRTEMMLFMEEKVGNNLFDLSNERMRIEAGLRDNHQVDIVMTYRDKLIKMTQLVDEQLPALTTNTASTLSVRNERRDLEAEIVPGGKIYIGCEPELSVSSPPKSLSLVKSITADSFAWSICNYKSKIYIGMQNCSINVIETDRVTKGFVNLASSHWPYGINIHQDRVYVLISSNPCKIAVYDLSGKMITQWNRVDRCHFTRLAIVSNQIVIPDSQGKRISVYSLTGQLVRHIPCNFFREKGPAICSVDQKSVIVTSYSGSLVCRVDITSGQTIWSSNDVTNPEATAMFGKDLVCIASEQNIAFLSVHTGRVESALSVPELSGRRAGYQMDIDIDDNTLIASTYEGGFRVLYFQLKR